MGWVGRPGSEPNRTELNSTESNRIESSDMSLAALFALSLSLSNCVVVEEMGVLPFLYYVAIWGVSFYIDHDR